MPKPKQRKQVTKRYQINLERGLTSRFDDAFSALEAARKATKHARAGWTAEVASYSGRGMYHTGRKTVHMTCRPQMRGAKTVAACVLKPAFKKRVRGF